MLSRVTTLLAVLVIGSQILCFQSVAAQEISSRTNQLRLVYDTDHSILLAPPSTGWPSTGTFTFTFPIPPINKDAGFVEKGTPLLNSLQWDDIGKYWKAVATENGLGGNGTNHFLTKWAADGTELANSSIYDSAGVVSMNNTSMLLSGTTGSTPDSGAGTRLMWIPEKRALRAGQVSGTQWDNDHIGENSVAFGNTTESSGPLFFAWVHKTKATADYSVAMGMVAEATAMSSVALGSNVQSSGLYSTSIGFQSRASAISTTAIGYNVTASGPFSTALGMGASTNEQAGSFVYGDASGTPIGSTAPNQFVVRAEGGVHLATTLGSNTTNFRLVESSLLISGSLGATPASGSGTRLMWVPAKAAFRAGAVSGTQWNNSSIGSYSVALGENTKASGQSSFAMGSGASANGMNSIAMGSGTSANGTDAIAIGYNVVAGTDFSTAIGYGSFTGSQYFATALGFSTEATGYGSIALGYMAKAQNQNSTALGTGTTASGNTATAIGAYTTASGEYSTAIGYAANVSGHYSMAMGYSTNASGLYSTAMGNYVSTNGFSGSFIYGDNSTTTLYNTAANQFMVRARGGVQFITTASDTLPSFSLIDGALLMRGTTGPVPDSGAGTRMMWIPEKKAFRAGEVSGERWDHDSIGLNSSAFGLDTKADGYGSFAAGVNTTASTAFSFAMGQFSTASSAFAVALGYDTKASGTSSLATGYQTSASNFGTTAMGTNTSASGSNSTAMGSHVSTNSFVGSFIYGDNSTGVVKYNTAPYQFMIRAIGGFHLLSSSQDTLPDFTITGGTLLLRGTEGSTPDTGAGTRMMWIGEKQAFRAGQVSANNWDNDSIGQYSVAFGRDTKASEAYTFAVGDQSAATAPFAAALGFKTEASGTSSFATGNESKATGFGATATGVSTSASGVNSTAMGTTVSTNGLSGSFIYGDNSSSTVKHNTTQNQFMVRAIGGFELITNMTDTLSEFSINNSSLLLRGDNGITLDSGAGTRMMWVADKQAFRAGAVTGDQWNSDSIGSYSAAFGKDTKARGIYSFATGEFSNADGAFSVAMGQSATANSTFAVALGYATLASGTSSFASGAQTQATNYGATAMGVSTSASGMSSTALGSYVSTNGNSGSFIYGDNSSSTVKYNTAQNQFMVRAIGGVQFNTFHSDTLANLSLTNEFIVRAHAGTTIYSDVASSIGVNLAANGNSWASVSDSNRKENRLNINGEDVLSSISKMWMGSWNYKGQDATHRHYGPMAQEFFAAFGKDGIGIIGNDTTLATADVDGVTLIAVKALIERTKLLSEENAVLREELNALRSEVRSQSNVQRVSVK